MSDESVSGPVRSLGGGARASALHPAPRLDCVSKSKSKSFGVDVDDGFDDGFDDAGDVDVSRCDVVVGCATTGG